MANASILFENKADAVSVTASSWIAAAPPSMLQNAHVSRRWKGRNGDTEFILTGLISGFDTVALFGLQGVFGDDVQRNLSSAAVSRVRVSSADSTGLSGDLYDSDDLPVFAIDDAYGALIHLLDAPISGYVRIDLSEAGAVALLAGRLVVGLRSTVGVNFQYGWSYGYVDLSRISKSAGGQTFVDLDDRIRTLNVTFGELSPAERNGFVARMDRINGSSRDVLFIIDGESSDLARDCIWGLLTSPNQPTQPFLDAFAKTIEISERR
jgi:hypothetical protein